MQLRPKLLQTILQLLGIDFIAISSCLGFTLRVCRIDIRDNLGQDAPFQSLPGLDKARENDEKWLGMSVEEQSKVEKTFMCGTVKHVPQAANTEMIADIAQTISLEKSFGNLTWIPCPLQK
eukprot:4203159-Amphidinium_carterae.1